MAPPAKKPRWNKRSRRRTARILKSISADLNSLRGNIHRDAVRLHEATRDSDIWEEEWENNENPIANLFKHEGSVQACQSSVDNVIRMDFSSEHDTDSADTASNRSVSSEDAITPSGLARPRRVNDDDDNDQPEGAAALVVDAAANASFDSNVINISDSLTIPSFESDGNGYNLFNLSSESVTLAVEGVDEQGLLPIDCDFTKLKITDDDNPESTDSESIANDDWMDDWMVDDDDEEEDEECPQASNDVNAGASTSAACREVVDNFIDVTSSDDEFGAAALEDNRVPGDISLAQDMASQVMGALCVAGPDGEAVIDDLTSLTSQAMQSAILESAHQNPLNDSIFSQETVDVMEDNDEPYFPPKEYDCDIGEVFASNYQLTARTVSCHFEKEAKLGTLNDRNKSLFDLFITVCNKRSLDVGQRNDMWEIIRGLTPERKLRGIRSSMLRYLDNPPKIVMFYEFMNLDSKEVVKVEAEKYPKGKFPRTKWIKVSEYAKLSLLDIWNHSRDIHEKKYGVLHVMSRGFDLFMDGLPCSKSGSDQLNVVCCKIPPCREKFVVAMHLYRRESSMNPIKILEELIAETRLNDFQIKRFIGDGPVRAKLKCLKLHSGAYSCEFCEAKGMHIDNKQCFPSDTYRARKRSNLWWKEMATAIKERGIENFTQDELKGLTGASPLALLPGFNMATQFVLEPMHNFGGCIKQLIRLILSLGKSQQNYTANQLRIMRAFDDRWVKILTPREFNRHGRTMHSSLKEYKTQEYLSIAICGLFAFGDAIDGGPSLADQYRVWMLLCYIIRAVMLNNTMFKDVVEKCKLEKKVEYFYQLMETTFGAANCSWNIHTFTHVVDIRQISRMPALSALGYEGFFSDVKRYMKPNTPSFPKQVMLRLFSGKTKTHECEDLVRFSHMQFKRTADNLIYTKTREFYEIKSVVADTYICNKFITKTVNTFELPNLVWRYVGVERTFAMEDVDFVVEKKDVVGKAIIDNHYIIAVPLDAFFT